jgi:hypothetical protein
MVSRAARVWLPSLVLMGSVVALLRVAAQPLDNPDTYFHLRFGHEFLHGWSLRDPGSVSTFATRDWLPTQWLPQVLMAWAEERCGLAAVAWFSGMQLVLLVLAVTYTCRRRADIVVVAFVVPLALAACWPALSMRPQVMSYAFMALVVHAWWQAALSGRRPWLLVPLTWLWAMCHGMWPFSLVVGAVGILAAVLHRRPGRAEVLRQVGVLAACAVAAALTPVGPGLYTAVLAVTDRARFFGEWSAPDLTSTYGGPLLVLGAVALLVHLRRGADWPRTLLLGLGLGLALYSSRTVPLAAVTLAPLACDALQQLVRRPAALVSRREARLGVAVAVVGLGILAAVTPHTADRPAKEVTALEDDLDALPAGTPVLNDWGDGGFVMWAHPQLDLLMHGYGDTFTIAELDRNSDILDLERGWQDLVRGTGAQVALLRTDHPLTAALEDEGWLVQERDDDVELLTAPDDWDD